MEIEILPYSEAGESAARALNERLRAGGEYEFQLPDRMPREPAPEALIRSYNYLAFEGDAVRGGFLLASFPGSFADGQEVTVINCREPISEGIVDARYSLLALRLLKYMQQQGPYMFALGMGSEQARFTRLLKSAGWTIEPVPFLFHVVKAKNFTLQLRQLQTGARRMLSRVAAYTGAASLGMATLQAKALGAGWKARGLSIEQVSGWGSWADELWEDFRRECSFCVKRDRATLMELYRLGQDRSMGYLVRRNGKPVGWIATQNTHFTNHKYFGAMQVATILDCIALADAIEGAIAIVSRKLARSGADLIVTNQSYRPYVHAFKQAGYLAGPSNYILAISKELSAAIAQQPGGHERTHFTRGDSDGRDNL